MAGWLAGWLAGSPGVDFPHQRVPGGGFRERVQAVAHVGLDEVQPCQGLDVSVRSMINLFQLVGGEKDIIVYFALLFQRDTSCHVEVNGQVLVYE